MSTGIPSRFMQYYMHATKVTVFTEVLRKQLNQHTCI